MSEIQFYAEIDCGTKDCDGFRTHLITFLKLDPKHNIVFFDAYCVEGNHSFTGYVSIDVWKKILPKKVEELN